MAQDKMPGSENVQFLGMGYSTEGSADPPIHDKPVLAVARKEADGAGLLKDVPQFLCAAEEQPHFAPPQGTREAVADRTAHIATFGGCPECGGQDGYVNEGPNHWFVCLRHKVRWWLAHGVFNSWRYETEAEWKRNSELLLEYKQVEPIFTQTHN